MIINLKDVLAVRMDRVQVYCMECVSEDDLANVAPEDYVFVNDAETNDWLVYCDCEEHVGSRRLN